MSKKLPMSDFGTYWPQEAARAPGVGDGSELLVRSPATAAVPHVCSRVARLQEQEYLHLHEYRCTLFLTSINSRLMYTIAFVVCVVAQLMPQTGRLRINNCCVLVALSFLSIIRVRCILFGATLGYLTRSPAKTIKHSSNISR